MNTHSLRYFFKMFYLKLQLFKLSSIVNIHLWIHTVSFLFTRKPPIKWDLRKRFLSFLFLQNSNDLPKLFWFEIKQHLICRWRKVWRFCIWSGHNICHIQRCSLQIYILVYFDLYIFISAPDTTFVKIKYMLFT